MKAIVRSDAVLDCLLGAALGMIAIAINASKGVIYLMVLVTMVTLFWVRMGPPSVVRVWRERRARAERQVP
jgi:hypothetical protein